MNEEKKESFRAATHEGQTELSSEGSKVITRTVIRKEELNLIAEIAKAEKHLEKIDAMQWEQEEKHQQEVKTICTMVRSEYLTKGKLSKGVIAMAAMKLRMIAIEYKKYAAQSAEIRADIVEKQINRLSRLITEKGAV